MRASFLQPLRRIPANQRAGFDAFLGLLICASAIAQHPPNTVDLEQYGYPHVSKAWNPDAALITYPGYYGLSGWMISTSS